MSIKITNTKSATELAGHIERNGEVFFNAGATTGAKRSEYKFNDITVTVPGSNIQVKIKPQETHTFNVSNNSFAGIALNNAKKELGLDDSGDIPPEPQEIIISTNSFEDLSAYHCNFTYEELKKMGNNLTGEFQLTMEESAKGTEYDSSMTYYTESGDIADMSGYTDGDTITDDNIYIIELIAIPISTQLENPNDIALFNIYKYNKDDEDYISYDDIQFFFVAGPQYYVIAIKPNNSFRLGITDAFGDDAKTEDGNASIYRIYVENDTINADLVVADKSSGYYYIDKTFTDWLVAQLIAKGYTEHIEVDYEIPNSNNIELNLYATELNQFYMLNNVYGLRGAYCSYDGGTDNIKLNVYVINTDSGNYSTRELSITRDSSTKEITSIEMFNISDADAEYDTVFSYDIQNNSLTMTGTEIPSEDEISKLVASNPNVPINPSVLVKILNPRLAVATLLTQDLVVEGEEFNLTIPSGSLLYHFVDFYYDDVFDDLYVWYINNEWNVRRWAKP